MNVTQLKSLLNGVPNVPMCPTYPMCPCALCTHMPKYILQTKKLKISVLMKSNEGSFTDVFKSTDFNLDFN